MGQQSNTEPPAIPDDLQIEVAVNEEAAFWTRTRDSTIESNINCERQKIINDNLLKLCELKIKAEEKKK